MKLSVYKYEKLNMKLPVERQVTAECTVNQQVSQSANLNNSYIC